MPALGQILLQPIKGSQAQFSLQLSTVSLFGSQDLAQSTNLLFHLKKEDLVRRDVLMCQEKSLAPWLTMKRPLPINISQLFQNNQDIYTPEKNANKNLNSIKFN